MRQEGNIIYTDHSGLNIDRSVAAIALKQTGGKGTFHLEDTIFACEIEVSRQNLSKNPFTRARVRNALNNITNGWKSRRYLPDNLEKLGNGWYRWISRRERFKAGA